MPDGPTLKDVGLKDVGLEDLGLEDVGLEDVGPPPVLHLPYEAGTQRMALGHDGHPGSGLGRA